MIGNGFDLDLKGSGFSELRRIRWTTRQLAMNLNEWESDDGVRSHDERAALEAIVKHAELLAQAARDILSANSPIPDDHTDLED